MQGCARRVQYFRVCGTSEVAPTVKLLTKNRPWVLVFAMLLLYATTADFVATTVVIADGKDCNHPWVRIEHKCVTSSVRTSSNDHSAVPTTSPVALIAVAPTRIETGEVLQLHPAPVEADTSPTHASTLPLLC